MPVVVSPTRGTLHSLSRKGYKDLTSRTRMASDMDTFQSVQADLPDTAETRVTVDGFENSLECKTAELSFGGFTFDGPLSGTINLTISSSDCNWTTWYLMRRAGHSDSPNVTTNTGRHSSKIYTDTA